MVANTKGGTGKSTIAMHLLVELMRRGYSVASIDADVQQESLSRYIRNRKLFCRSTGAALPFPHHFVFEKDNLPAQASGPRSILDLLLRLGNANDVIVVDTPGYDSQLGRLFHCVADTIITPVNDSFFDLDVLATIHNRRSGERWVLDIGEPSSYAMQVRNSRIEKEKHDGTSIRWIVVRNRLSTIYTRNKRNVNDALMALSHKLSFQLCDGFCERVLYREMISLGLTVSDINDLMPEQSLSRSRMAAIKELAGLITAVRLARPRTGLAGPATVDNHLSRIRPGKPSNAYATYLPGGDTKIDFGASIQ